MAGVIDLQIPILFQHAAARRRLSAVYEERDRLRMFQHAAARRRLTNYGGSMNGVWYVSTRSRPKAADPHGH